MENTLFFGDNLWVLRKYFPDESVDLIYLDPPFNSKANYNVLFGDSEESEAQIRAFDDTWHWGEESAKSYADVMEFGGAPAEVLEAFYKFLGHNDMMAYLVMMSPRLIELHRVLKNSGSVFLHCDPTASHYLKILLDAIFGAKQLRNEIIWCYRRYTAASNRFQRLHDIILFYGKSDKTTFNDIRIPYGEKSGKRDSHYKQDEDGRWFRWQKRKGKEPYKVYLSEGVRLGDWWEIPHINASSLERLGYQTQKPLALLERIVQAASNEGDIVLDPFCGCGTAIHAAQKLNRLWAGIDITHLAIGLIEYRLQKAFGISPKTIGAPEDLAGAQELFNRDPFQLEAWAVTRLLGIKPNARQRGDHGIDGVGRFYLGTNKDGKAHFGKILVSVKGGKNLGVSMVRDFRGAMERDGADLGVMITLADPTSAMTAEAAGAGRFRGISDEDFPKIQIYTIKDFFEGRRPKLPSTIKDPRRKAREESGEQHKLI